jgi:hypothetical protein
LVRQRLNEIAPPGQLGRWADRTRAVTDGDEHV